MKKLSQYKAVTQHIQSLIKSSRIFASQKEINMFLISWDSVVSIANCYRLDGLGIKSQGR
jgi:hypothetical protein